MSIDRQKALELAISQIIKKHGEGAVMKLGELSLRQAVEAIPTGSPALDIALGIGGIPRGRVTEIFGAESSGKTTLALHIIAQTQKAGGQAFYIDAEQTFSCEYAATCGVKWEELQISQPDYGEQALDIAEELVKTACMDLIVIDSVAALVPRAEIEGEMGDSHMGLQARLMSQALRKLVAAMNKSQTAIVFINQLREKVGIVFGNPETTPGGRALKFYSSVRIDLRKGEVIKHGSDIVGTKIRAKVVKNKVAPPFRAAEFDLLFKSGISREGDIIDLGTSLNILKKSGTFYIYNEIKLGQGRENAREYLMQHPDIADELESQIRAASIGK
ncbi:MAG TPA: recombinase RecA [Dehalococcoidia bacterium]|nr:recombinase RecA [Dehalococcoidia bacterium]